MKATSATALQKNSVDGKKDRARKKTCSQQIKGSSDNHVDQHNRLLYFSGFPGFYPKIWICFSVLTAALMLIFIVTITFYSFYFDRLSVDLISA